MMKQIEAILPPPPPHMVGDGFRVHHFFPGAYDLPMSRMSPFFMLDYASKHVFAPSANARGVDTHPHRGFETVTIAFEGSVAHHDSAGNSGTIEAGEVQWMTAGSGVLHKEYHSEEFTRNGGTFQMAQIWVNLPKAHKMTKPKYQGITRAMIPVVDLANGAGRVEVIAGNFQGNAGAAETFSPLQMWVIKLAPQGSLTFQLPETDNSGLLAVEGKVLVNQAVALPLDHFMLFGHSGTEVTLTSEKGGTFLLLSGEPIDEPIVSYGPFVMNTREEIAQAYEDFRSGKFGDLN